MAESNQLMDFTDMFRATEENDENLGANMHITNGLVKASGEDPTSLELYYPEVPAQDFRELPASVHTLLTNLVSQKLSSSKVEQNNRTTTVALESQIERMQGEIELLRNQVLVERQDKKAASDLSDSLKEEMRRKDQLWSGERKNLEGRLHKLSSLSTQFQAAITQKEKEMNKLKDHLERANNRLSRRSTQEEPEDGAQTIEMSQTLAQKRGGTIATSSSMSEREELEQRLRNEVRHLREMFAALQTEHNLLITTFNALLDDYEALRRGEESETEKEIRSEEGEEVNLMISEYRGRGTAWNRNNSDLVLGVRREELGERWSEFEEKRERDNSNNDDDRAASVLEDSFLDQSVVEEESVWKARFEDAMKLLKEQDDIIKQHLRSPPSQPFEQEDEDDEEEKTPSLSQEAIHAMQHELECLQDERVVLEKVLHDTLQEKHKLTESFIAMTSMVAPVDDEEDDEDDGLEHSMAGDNSLLRRAPFSSARKQLHESPLSVASRSSVLSSQSTPRVIHDQSFSLPSPSRQTTELLKTLVSPLRHEATLRLEEEEGRGELSEISIEEDEDGLASPLASLRMQMGREDQEEWEDDLEEEEDMV